MVGDQKVLLFVAYRVQMLYKTVSESVLGLTDVQEATSGVVDTLDQVDGCADEPMSDVKGLFWALNGGDGGGVGAGVELLTAAGKGAECGRVVEVAENDMLDVEVGGVICEDKGDSVFIFVGERVVRAEVWEMQEMQLRAFSITV
eukprot:g33914.t1